MITKNSFFLPGVFSILIGITSSAFAATPATFVACSNIRGQITVKAKCAKNESRVSLSSLKEEVYSTIPYEGPGIIHGIPPGETVKGSIFEIACGSFGSFNVSLFLAPYPFKLKSENTIVRATPAVTSECVNLGDCLNSEEVAQQSQCTGSFSNPTAPPGMVCIYPDVFFNVRGIQASGSGGYGFYGFWSTAPGTSCSNFSANWAFTAP
jgi:hypothetical protein